MANYFDSAAAELASPEILELFAGFAAEYSGNQEALHAHALRMLLSRAGETLGKTLTGGEDYSVIWCAGGTDAANLLCTSGICAGKKVLTSRLEHPATARICDAAQTLVFAPCDNCGRLIPEAGIVPEVMVLHQTQSELGTNQDPALFRQAFPEALLITDAVQSALKMPLYPADVILISGAKFGIPGQGGAVLVRKSRPECRILTETAASLRREHRVNRLYPPTLLTLARTAELRRDFPDAEKIRRLNEFSRHRVQELGLDCTVPGEFSASHILHVLLPEKYQGAVIVRMLKEEYGISAASGSACAAESSDPSPALTAIKVPLKRRYSGLRLSFSGSNTLDEAEFLFESLKKALQNY